MLRIRIVGLSLLEFLKGAELWNLFVCHVEMSIVFVKTFEGHFLGLDTGKDGSNDDFSGIMFNLVAPETFVKLYYIIMNMAKEEIFLDQWEDLTISSWQIPIVMEQQLWIRYRLS
ncbi:hypothetical protein MKW98_013113 [Papaver atlanticum]|uniref:Uncharacterized protein n=1 Tax=Papaver atlanticum TaxID=357466 RepID=A0AAD4XSA0_9MAGN|nr:hypothetical protein MKW98_013113 [Papaver atlanticum]